MKHAESVFFLLATVAALVLPALPMLQEWQMQEENIYAALPAVVMEPVVVTAQAPLPSPRQVALVR